MKRIAILACILLVAGCNVYMSDDYADDLAATAASARYLSDLCVSDPNTCAESLEAVTEYVEALSIAIRRKP